MKIDNKNSSLCQIPIESIIIEHSELPRYIVFAWYFYKMVVLFLTKSSSHP